MCLELYYALCKTAPSGVIITYFIAVTGWGTASLNHLALRFDILINNTVSHFESWSNVLYMKC